MASLPTTRRFGDLLQGLPVEARGGAMDALVSGIAFDTRRLNRGDLFVAVEGYADDGHRYLAEAKEKGASAVVVSKGEGPAGLPWARVRKSRFALSFLADRFRGSPSRKLTVYGVTGTNGKTSTVYILHHLVGGAPQAARLSTVENAVGAERFAAPHTTMDPVTLHRLFGRMAAEGIGTCVMEVSSHALDLERVAHVAFDGAVLTNITQDHLDFHGTMEAYAAAKAKLFRELPENSGKEFTAAFNFDDPVQRELFQSYDRPAVWYGEGADAALRVEEVVVSPSGSRFVLRWQGAAHAARIPLPGRFQVFNAAAAVALLLSKGASLAEAIARLEDVPPVPGRLESVEAGQPFVVLVDYAHTPDALRKALLASRELTRERLIVVFGCGGDRDRKKRPLMGRAAQQHADMVVVTSDNPRTEDPEAIIADILRGVADKDAAGGSEVVVKVDRTEAIETALRRAGPGDTVLIAGKGHETYQIFADRTIPYDDREVARDVLGRLK